MNPHLRPVVACAWLLMLLTFTAPGRDGPNEAGSMDVIALAKLGVRAGSLLIGAWAVLTADPARRMRLMRAMGLWAVFLAWAGVSVLWTALPSVTVGQTIGLTALLLVGCGIALHWRGPTDTEAILRHLTLALFVFSAIILTVDLVHHDISGLNRDDHEFEMESNGIIHPTTAGGTASLGLMMVLSCWLLWGWPWARWLSFAAVPAHAVLMVLANSRMAMAMAAACVGLIVLGFTPRKYLAALALAASVVGATVLVVDPGRGGVESAYTTAMKYVKRGESDESLSSLTGRTELWDAIWDSFQQSPVIGHGFYVTSRSGLLDVWAGPANRTAHNTLLQVMVTTGLVGLAIWAAALLASVSAVGSGLWSGPGDAAERGRVAALLAVFALWYAGWGQLAEGFMGGVLPESVLFFALLGLGLGPYLSAEAA